MDILVLTVCLFQEGGGIMTPLRAKMIRALEVRRLAPRTRESYVSAVVGLAKYYRQSPDQLSGEQIQDYLHHLIQERQLAWSSCNVAITGIRFFYREVLGDEPMSLCLPPCKKQRRLPEVLSRREVERLLIAPRNPKHGDTRSAAGRPRATGWTRQATLHA